MGKLVALTGNIAVATAMRQINPDVCAAYPITPSTQVMEQFSEYVEYIADRRLERIDLPKVYGAKNPFPWMSQATDLNKEKNFFETRVTEYQTSGSLDWGE